MLSAGASGYLLKEGDFRELTDAIRMVVSNQVYLSPRIAGIVTEGYVRHLSEADSSAHSILTPREREVLQLLTEGLSAKNIASHLQLSVKTVEGHRQKIMGKLKVNNVAELTKYAIREGLTTL